MEQQDPLGRSAPACACAPAEQQDERTRERLLRAAVDVFDRKGYAAASVREIVELAGVAKPALYYHFGSKERLLLTVLDAAAQEFSRATDRALLRPGTARDRLLALALDLHGLFRQHVPVVRVAHAVFFGPVESVPPFDFARFDREIEGTVRKLVDEGQATGEIRRSANATDVSVIIMGIIGTLAMRQIHKDIAQLDADTLTRLVGLVFDGGLSGQREQGEQGQ
jgi:TetR/AcrR family transcriptional regulator